MSNTLATVGIISIGEMGMGIAKLLIARNYRVVTNLEGRSQETKTRAESASIENLKDDHSFVQESDYILSIVPPRDALSTATRISTAFNTLSLPKLTPLYYFDLNAISPASSRKIAELFATKSPAITFIDGGIIGGAPVPKSRDFPPSIWFKPSIPISGPLPSSLPDSYAGLASTLGLNHISDDIGVASGLKCCFATTTKGFTALCIQAFTTASNLGVLDHLTKEMEERIPGLWNAGSKGVTVMPPKAYRWIHEMDEISKTHAEDGAFQSSSASTSNNSSTGGVFTEIAEVYRAVADDTVLGEEKTESRKRGLDVKDVALAIGEGLKAKRRKTE